MGRRRHGPLSVQRPFFPEGDSAHVYLLHPPGGIAGGDDLEIDVSLAGGSSALVTTPGAAKFYRSRGPVATQSQALWVADGALLEWFPQENIFFPGANARIRTDIHLDGTARVAAWEIQCLGRPVIDERFDRGSLDAALNLVRDGRPVLRERLRVDGDAGLDGRSGLRGFPVSATLLLNGADKDVLEAARRILPEMSGSLVHGLTLVEDLLLARVLARATEPVRRVFTALWREWRPRVPGRAPCEPRIWAT